jgi:hypothetical protein
MRIVVTGAGGFGGSALAAARISPIASASATTAAPPISRLDRWVWRAAAPTRETPYD